MELLYYRIICIIIVYVLYKYYNIIILEYNSLTTDKNR